MKKYHDLLNISYQRAISPDYHGFFERFYHILVNADPKIEELFANTDMDRQINMLMQSMTFVISFANTLEADEEMEHLASIHGKGKLNIPGEFYDIWLDCLIKTISECDPEFNDNVETAWRVTLAPGLAYMKAFCD